MHWPLKHVLLGATFVATAVGVCSTPAYARGIGAGYIDGPGVSAVVDAPVDETGRASRGTNMPSEEVCTTTKVNPQVEGVFRWDEDTGRLVTLFDAQHPQDQGQWMRKTCTTRWVITSERMFWQPNVDPADLARQAIDHADLPTPVIPISATLPAVTLTGFPQWFWIDKAAWRTVTATASAGGVTATATATPSKVVWDSGDGRETEADRQLTCKGPGKPLPQTIDIIQRRSQSDCLYYYRHTSGHEPDLAFTLTATMTWNVTWNATTGASGGLGTVTRSASIPIKVGEYQVVNITPTGGP